MCIRYYIVSDLDNVLQSGCYESTLDNSNVDWSVEEAIKLEEKNCLPF